MLQFTSNQALEAQEEEKARAEQEAKERQNRPVITSLAGYLRTAWEASKEAKQPIERKMTDALRRRNGEYSSTKLAEIRSQGGSEIFMMLTDEKCSAAVSWLSDILFPAGDKPWGIKPTPVPDMNQGQMAKIQQEVQQSFLQEILAHLQANHHAEVVAAFQSGQIKTDEQAKQFFMAKASEVFNPEAINQELQSRAEEIAQEIRSEMEQAAKEARDRVETKLHDVIIEAGWEDAVHDALDDIATFKAGVVKGPVLRKKRRMAWEDPQGEPGQFNDAGFQGESGGRVVKVIEPVAIDFNRVSPFDIYPLPNARKPEDGLFERHQLTRKKLQSFIGVKGYDDDAIRLVLKEYGSGSLSSWLAISNDQTRQQLENRPNEWRSPEPTIDALQFWGNIQGLKLLQYGMSPEEIPDPFADYSVEVWLIGNYVIKAEINGDPLGRVPYNFASMRKRNGSIWGDGVPDIIKDCQDACNASARAIINNMGISSGPQVMVDVAQLPPGENIKSMYPWKIWQVNSTPVMGAAGNKPPLDFFVPPSVSAELMNVYKFFSDEADNKIGIPKFTYGGDAKGGALGTASGFSMMMSNATRGIKNVVRNIDNGIIKPSIERTHEFQLLFFNDPEYHQGDIKIIARGSTAMIAKEQSAVRRNELLRVVTGSPQVLGIVGADGLAAMLREIFQGADFKEEIVPDKRTMTQRQEQERQAALAQQERQMLLTQSGQGKKMNQETDPAGNVAGGRDARTV